MAHSQPPPLPPLNNSESEWDVHTGEHVRLTPTTRERIIEHTPKWRKHWRRYKRAAWEEATAPQKAYYLVRTVLLELGRIGVLWFAAKHYPFLYQLMVGHGR